MNDIWDSFKAVSYGLNHMGAAVYIDLTKPDFRLLLPELGNPLIFSGVTLSYHAPSTVNDAEAIVSKILKEERIKIADRDFYDLQTWKGYHEFKEGQFVLNRLSFKRNTKEVRVSSWQEIKSVPPDFNLIFLCLIGHNARNISQQGT